MSRTTNAASGEGRTVDARSSARCYPAEDVLRRGKSLWRQVNELSSRLEDALAELEEKERRLKESEELFRVTFEKAAAGMAHVAPDGRWLRVNKKLLNILGYEEGELLGLTFRDIACPENLDAGPRYLDRMLRGEVRSYSIEKRHVKKDGSCIWICLSVSLMCGSSGEPEYFISVVEDVTECKLAELVPDPLTEREMEVLRLILEGRTNRQIAGELAYSEASIKLHVQRILAKLGVDRRARAARRAIEIGLLSPPPEERAEKRPGEKDAKRLRNISRFGVPSSICGR